MLVHHSCELGFILWLLFCDPATSFSDVKPYFTCTMLVQWSKWSYCLSTYSKWRNRIWLSTLSSTKIFPHHRYKYRMLGCHLYPPLRWLHSFECAKCLINQVREMWTHFQMHLLTTPIINTLKIDFHISFYTKTRVKSYPMWNAKFLAAAYLYVSVLCQIFVFVTKIYKVILLTDVLDLSDLRPVLIESTIACLMLMVLLDSYTVYVEVSVP